MGAWTVCQAFLAFPIRGRDIVLRCGLGDRAMQECNPSTGPSEDCGCIPSRVGLMPARDDAASLGAKR